MSSFNVKAVVDATRSVSVIFNPDGKVDLVIPCKDVESATMAASSLQKSGSEVVVTKSEEVQESTESSAKSGYDIFDIETVQMNRDPKIDASLKKKRKAAQLSKKPKECRSVNGTPNYRNICSMNPAFKPAAKEYLESQGWDAAARRGKPGSIAKAFTEKLGFYVSTDTLGSPTNMNTRYLSQREEK